MGKALAGDLRTLLGLGEDEGALQDRLYEHADALGAPSRVGRVETLCGFDVFDEGVDVRCQAALAGGADVRMGRIGFLQQRAEKTGVVWQLAAQDLDAEIDV